jgi:hypothetical protein
MRFCSKVHFWPIKSPCQANYKIKELSTFRVQTSLVLRGLYKRGGNIYYDLCGIKRNLVYIMNNII